MKLKYAFLVSILLSSASFAADDITVDMTVVLEKLILRGMR